MTSSASPGHQRLFMESADLYGKRIWGTPPRVDARAADSTPPSAQTADQHLFQAAAEVREIR